MRCLQEGHLWVLQVRTGKKRTYFPARVEPASLPDIARIPEVPTWQLTCESVSLKERRLL